VVIGRLEVEEGDAVAEGQVIAVLDSWTLEKTEIARLEAELENARAEVRRREELGRDGVVSPSERDAWRTKVAVVDAQLARARAEADMAVVRSPLKGRVLDIFARAGERVGPDGIAEIAETEQMYAVAEVYETDIARVRVGQRATVTSPALPQALDGAVEVIHLKVGKKDVLDTDPAARTDARVVEVEIRLEDSRAAAGLTNLQVQVAIAP
jgi:HlyD family secretion protein